jgi:translation initiation factor IF-2
MSDQEKPTKINLETRPPIVTIMGHVDHGKTSILDAIRKSDVVSGEYGGITQHIGAYQITYNSKEITFIDTPGHEAFAQMRARGGKAADIVILVVAADEGVKPQTREAISHAKASAAHIIVAINKIDKAGANPQKVKQELASDNILVEDWGGDIISIELSAKTKEGIDKLLDAILLVAEMQQLKADLNGELEAIIIESRLDKKRGVVVSCIVRNGTLSVGDKVEAGKVGAKVKSIMDDKGKMLKSAGPSKPIEVLGFNHVPHVGDLIMKTGSDLAELTSEGSRVEIVGSNAKKTIALVLKADTEGTLEAVKGSLSKLVTSSVGATYALKFLYCGTGDISESDVLLALSTKGVVIGFNVKIPSGLDEFAETNNVSVKVYKTIYELVDDAEKILQGTALKEESKIKGRAEILKLFKLQSGDMVLGSKVVAGALKPGIKISIYDKNPADITKEDVPLYMGTIKSLKKGKEEVALVGKDNECGVLLKPQFEEVRDKMWIEVR